VSDATATAAAAPDPLEADAPTAEQAARVIRIRADLKRAVTRLSVARRVGSGGR